MSSYPERFLKEVTQIAQAVPVANIEKMISILCDVREKGGRLFFLGVGGSAANCSHAVNDFRKIGGFEAYSPVDYARSVGARVLGLLGRNGGYTAKNADACVIIPTLSQDTITPHAESWQSVIWHLLVSDPRLMQMSNKWESMDKKALETKRKN